MTIRVAIVDDQALMRDGFGMILDAQPDIEVVGDARSGAEALVAVRELRPHVILLDLRLPDMLGCESTRLLRMAAPGIKILIFTAHAEHPALQLALDAGADGALLKDVADADLADAILRTARGERVLDSRFEQDPAAWRVPAGNSVDLTKREYEILRRVAMGETNPEIADALSLSRNTVKTYFQSALQKLGARNRVEAIVKAGEAGLL
jgi:DNA-binding NarL/FixJ family response regulator